MRWANLAPNGVAGNLFWPKLWRGSVRRVQYLFVGLDCGQLQQRLCVRKTSYHGKTMPTSELDKRVSRWRGLRERHPVQRIEMANSAESGVSQGPPVFESERTHCRRLHMRTALW